MQDPRRETDDDLTFDIGYALWRGGLKLDIARCRAIAAGVVTHLKLCRWDLKRRAPEQPHGSFKPPDKCAPETSAGGGATTARVATRDYH